MTAHSLPRPTSAETAIPPSTVPKVVFNWEDWLPLLDDEDIPDAQKREWIEAVWSVVCGFMGIGCEITDTAEICGKDIDLSALLNAAVVDSSMEREDV